MRLYQMEAVEHKWCGHKTIAVPYNSVSLSFHPSESPGDELQFTAITMLYSGIPFFTFLTKTNLQRRKYGANKTNKT